MKFIITFIRNKLSIEWLKCLYFLQSQHRLFNDHLVHGINPIYMRWFTQGLCKICTGMYFWAYGYFKRTSKDCAHLTDIAWPNRVVVGHFPCIGIWSLLFLLLQYFVAIYIFIHDVYSLKFFSFNPVGVFLM